MPLKAKTAHQHADAVADEAATPSMLQQVTDLEQQVTELKEQQLRSQADYRNLQRRTQEERVRMIQLATSELVGDLLEPLDHLTLAAAQLQDKGLDMVVKQLWSKLEQHGLEVIEVQGQPFDPNTMEVVEKQGEATTVSKVVSRGYRLNGHVIRHAKVTVGTASAESTTSTS